MDKQEAFKSGVLDWQFDVAEHKKGDPHADLGTTVLALTCQEVQDTEEIAKALDEHFKIAQHFDEECRRQLRGVSIVASWALRWNATKIRSAIQERLDQADEGSLPDWMGAIVVGLESLEAKTTEFIEPILIERDKTERVERAIAQREEARRQAMTPEARATEDFHEQWNRNHPGGRNFY